MATIPETYLDEKIGEAYGLMVRKEYVRAGVEAGLRPAFEAAVDRQALAEAVDRALTLEVEMRAKAAFKQALERAQDAWEPPHVTARVDFLADRGGEWAEVGSAEVALDGYVQRMPLSEVRDMAEDWDRWAEPVADDLVMGGAVEAPQGWKLAVCRRPQGLDDYVAAMRPVGR